MKFTNFKTWLNENVKDGVTVLLPGGFKPMHIGHVDLVKRYAEHPDVKEVLVLIGPGVRNGIDQTVSLKIAKELLADFDNVTVEAVKYPSPVLTIYKYIETAEPGTYAMAAVRKGKDDEDYKRVLKFVENFNVGGKYYEGKPKGVNVVELPVNTEPIFYHGRTDAKEGEPISASTLRRDILNDDYENFKTNYPGYPEEVTKNIWDMLKPIVVEGVESEYEEELNEKFKSETDPIRDMEMGIVKFWKEEFEKQRNITPAQNAINLFGDEKYHQEAFIVFHILKMIVDNNVFDDNKIQKIVNGIIDSKRYKTAKFNAQKIIKVLNDRYHMNVTKNIEKHND
jgi:hypothetical protein